MNKFLLIAAVAFSTTSAFAQRCEVDLVDNFNRVYQTFTAVGDPRTCIEGMKQCRKTIRFNYSGNSQYPNRNFDCVRAGVGYPGYTQQPIPQQPIPQQPYPQQPIPQQPYPQQPIPQYNTDSIRFVTAGESVIFNNAYYTVAGVAFNGAIALKDSWNNVRQGILRQDIAVTNGCDSLTFATKVCVSASVIDISATAYKTVAALSYQSGFIVKDSWNNLKTVANTGVAVTQGCAYSIYGGQICVGNQVIASNNTYYTVAGIQYDGRVVLKDSWNNLKVNVETGNLVITR